ncbi:MAG: type II toxin-antitoxin system RelE/ParE family toxin [Chloroflexi bacterium]|nr:type II toxin-antitoxin system RelE/ParE family toxin [Chloroflexota bacterium]
MELLPKALDDLHHLDKAVAQRVLRRLQWLSDNVDTIAAETLAGEFEGLRKLRVGSYRVLYTVTRAERVIIVHQLGDRKDIYKRR